MTARNPVTPLPTQSAEIPQEDRTSLEQKIRDRAYEIYEQRGRQDGSPDQDWLQAEGEILATTKALKAAA